MRGTLKGLALGASMGTAAAGLTWVAAAPAAAHGGVGGPQDVLQDYGVLIFLLAIVLVGAGVVAWVTLLPPEPLPDDDPRAQGGGPPSGGKLPAAAGGREQGAGRQEPGTRRRS